MKTPKPIDTFRPLAQLIAGDEAIAKGKSTSEIQKELFGSTNPTVVNRKISQAVTAGIKCLSTFEEMCKDYEVLHKDQNLTDLKPELLRFQLVENILQSKRKEIDDLRSQVAVGAVLAQHVNLLYRQWFPEDDKDLHTRLRALSEKIAELTARDWADRPLPNAVTPELEQLRDELSATLREEVPRIAALTHDKRYIVHGDIQPCVVLYSDETTTLVRLDENDMMCETSTIEWSDELTYRCQEMLRGEAKRSGGHVSLPTIKLVAQLVRDERILLNDDGGSYQWKPAMDDRARCVKPDVKYVASKTCMTCLRVSEGTLDLCPQCHTPFGGSDNA